MNIWHGCNIPRRHVAVATKFRTMASNVWVSSIWNFIHVILLALRILREILDFSKFVQPVFKLRKNTINSKLSIAFPPQRFNFYLSASPHTISDKEQTHLSNQLFGRQYCLHIFQDKMLRIITKLPSVKTV
jgi:hypothetical protein